MGTNGDAHDPSAPFGGTSPRCAQGGTATQGSLSPQPL